MFLLVISLQWGNNVESEQTPSYYAIIPAKVRYDQNVPANAKLLYGEITALCNKEGYCWATNAYFANLYGVHKNTVSDWIAKLVIAEHITLELIYEEGTRQVKYRYIRLAGQGIKENHDRPIQEIAEDNNTRLSTKVNTTSNIDHFEQFWSVYPRKVGKANARKAWAAKVTSDQIIKDIAFNVEQRILQGEWSDVKFIPHPATYLNGARWEDDLQVNAQSRIPKQSKSSVRLRDVPIEDKLKDDSWCKQ